MINQHSVFPPLEQLKCWENQHFDEGENVDVLLIEAYQAGADQELEACCNIALTDPCCGTKFQRYNLVRHIKEQRRSKPSSLKKEALADLDAAERCYPADWSTIRRALEALPE